MPIEVNRRLTIPDSELQWRFQPSGGPGGQHANRARTQAELSWALAESAVVTGELRSRLLSKLGSPVVVIVDDERSQTRNRSLATQRLAVRVREAMHVPKKRLPTKRSRGSQRRRLNAKSRNARTKELRRRPMHDD